MATLEALEELWKMGFLIEEEYLARRAALGAGPPENDNPSTTTQNNPVETTTTTSYDPYNPYGFNDPYSVPVTDPIVAPVDSEPVVEEYVPPISTVSIDPPVQPYESVPVITPVEDAPSTDPTVTVKPTAPSDEFKETFPNLYMQQPAKDPSLPDPCDFNPGPNHAIIVHRSAGRYLATKVDAPTTVYQAIQALTASNTVGSAGECYLAGSMSMKVENNGYWTNNYYTKAEPVKEVLPGKVYEYKETRYQNTEWPISVDERVIWRYLQANVSQNKTDFQPYYFDSVPWDKFEHDNDRKVEGVREMGVGCPTPFDPRPFLRHHMTHLDQAFPRIGASHQKTTGPIRLKLMQPTVPRGLLLPCFLATLKALQARLPSYIVDAMVLPSDAASVWARVNKCLEEGKCYYTGEPAQHASFLSAKLHSEVVVDLYYKVRESGVAPSGKPSEPTSDATPASTSEASESAPVPKLPSAFAGYYRDRNIYFGYDEFYVYTESDPPVSYGWPSAESTAANNTSAATNYGKRVSIRRDTSIQELCSQLAQLSGPSYGQKS